MSGKGDAQRPAAIGHAAFEDRWAATFGHAPKRVQADPQSCPHNHRYMDLYEYGSGTQRWTCSACWQSFDAPR